MTQVTGHGAALVPDDEGPLHAMAPRGGGPRLNPSGRLEIENPGTHDELCSTYHDVMIMVGMGASLCRAITPDAPVVTCWSRGRAAATWVRIAMSESHGKLLWASVNYLVVDGEGFSLVSGEFVS
ncbi:hypothetical protein D1007_55907 [Hordeum vulgare]|nr:hypothetical protein D1007_55907 [Hordeum vulgare]